MSTVAKRLPSAIAFLALLAAAMIFRREGQPAASSPLVISEVLLRNRFTLLDANNHTFPWVELANRGTAAVELEGYSLTNNPKNARKWKLPRETLAPGEYRVVWLPVRRSGSLEEREILMLVAPDGRSADAVVIPRQTEDRSYARVPGGSGPFRYHLTPSPGRKNEGPWSSRPIPSIPQFSPGGGIYDRRVDVRVEISLPLDGYEIRYSNDGSAPLPTSTFYPGPIALLPAPRGASRTIRAAAFYRGERVSQIQTQSYFMEELGLSLPLLSISTAPSNFERIQLDWTAHGPSAEHEVSVEAFSPEGRRTMGLLAGMRIHGNTGREGGFTTKKSYRLHFRNRYGDGSLEYPLVPHSAGPFQRLVLRANNDDSFRRLHRATYVRDQLVRELHEQMGGVVSHGAWYDLFVNMQFKGVYNVAERIDGDFLRAHVRDGASDWDVLQGETVTEGDSSSWDRLLAIARSGDLGEERAYEEVARCLDIESFTDYTILNIWAQNHDWPHKNFFAVRPRRPEGKWMFVSWDAELTLGLYPAGYDANTFERTLTRPGAIRDIFSALFQNVSYQELFLDRLERHLEGVLDPRRVQDRLHRLRAMVNDDVTTEIGQLFSERHVSLWKRNLDDLEEFVRQRPAAVRRHVYSSDRFRVPRLTEAVASDRGGSPTLRLRGLGFTDRMRVAIDGIEAPIVSSELPEAVEILVPEGGLPAGARRITVSDPGTGSSSRSDLLRVARKHPAEGSN